ncbi:glycoside hydrolase family 3 protein [Xylanimonas oleitrophica]|uniref:beta-N-acetylhexosaminidase n=1 Tax=Xylanimonas oleitrophica TaxID=2607479 RepID=A0A2W5WP41_9MICO|nr:glycoside hydrolase family 3 N-terminal domain-containing protein [Xylanimonas oleitrophica]PZR52920.1 glycoside hydrolase family 3 protein [Xylanimonas oleitrophica]
MRAVRRSSGVRPLRVGGVAGLLLAVVLLAACTGGSPAPSPVPPPEPSEQGSAPEPPGAGAGTSGPGEAGPPSPTASSDPLAGWTLEQKVGQLLMVGADVGEPADVTTHLLTDRHVGGLFLHGRTSAGADAVRALVDGYRQSAEQGSAVPLLVSTDQEGGLVQVLRGPGFSELPRATEQLGLPDLPGAATVWGSELAATGVDVNLAPVADLVPPDVGEANAPVGAFGREYGHDARQAADGATAFAEGMLAAGVVPTVKHFPGLGRVTQNTDTTAGVVDEVTTADDPSVGVFREVLDRLEPDGAGPGGERVQPWVMMSTAVYARIDPQLPAAFSPAVVGLLRDSLGFDGVVVTDDVSAAAQTQAWSPGERAVLAVEAGCDVVLASADPGVAPEMADALVARAQADPVFAARVDEAARRVLAAKTTLP